MTIADDVRSLIAEHLGLDPDAVTNEARFRHDLGADSLDAFDLLIAFEDQFDIEIPDNERDSMQRVSDAVAYIETRAASCRPRQRMDRTPDPSTENARARARRPRPRCGRRGRYFRLSMTPDDG